MSQEIVAVVITNPEQPVKAVTVPEAQTVAAVELPSSEAIEIRAVAVPETATVKGVAVPADQLVAFARLSEVGPAGFSGYSGFSGAGVTGASGYSGYSGEAGATSSGFSGYSGAGVSGYSGFSGFSGSLSGNQQIFRFSTTTTDSDPGSGNLRYNDATFASVTQVFVDNNNSSGTDVSAWLDTFDDTNCSLNRGYLHIYKYSDARLFASFTVTGSVVDGTGYRKLSVTPIVENGGVFGDTSDIVVSFSATGFSGFSGYSGYSSTSGYSGFCGLSGYSGFCGTSGYSGSGISGYSGYSGSGISGYSGFSAASPGASGYSGFCGTTGTSGFSGLSGYSGFCGLSGYSGYSGSGVSGYSGFSGANPGASGYSGFCGLSGYSGFSGVSGYSGISGYSGFSGTPLATTGVTTSPTASQTDTITHGLGKAPKIIRLYAIGTFTSNAAATPTTFCIGVWSSSGNRCIFQAYNTAAITTTQASAVSSTFSIRLDTGANNFITGVVQNVTATTFDIAWTETGTASAQNYMWETS